MTRDVFPLPVSIDEIDGPWLTAALGRRYAGAEVGRVDVVDVNNGTCTKIKLRLALNAAGRAAGIPERVVLKGGFEPHSRDMGHMHEVEARAYRDILPIITLPTPECYFADYDPERAQGIVIMEDLTLRGVTFCNPLRTQTYDQLRDRISVLARFHAPTWGTQALEAGGRWAWVKSLFEQLKPTFAFHLQPEPWARYMTMPRAAAVSVRYQSLDWMKRAVEQMCRLAERLPHSVLHGDTHPGNTYLDRSGAPGFFDPVSHRGPGVAEVVYNMIAALDVPDRRRWEGPLIQHYLDELKGQGVAAPGFDETMTHVAAFLPCGYLIWVTNETFMQSEAVNTAYTSRFSAAMLDHDSLGVLERL
jgi:hypothetical protein